MSKGLAGYKEDLEASQWAWKAIIRIWESARSGAEKCSTEPQNLPVCYHRSLAPLGPLPKRAFLLGTEFFFYAF